MEVSLSGTSNSFAGKINPKELTEDTYEYYCRLFLIERINEVIPITSEVQYRHIVKIIHSVNPILFEKLHLETNKILLLNEIYSKFMMVTNEELSREYLYKQMVALADVDPSNPKNSPLLDF